MPGINLVSMKDRSRDLATKFAKVQLSMRHDRTYKSTVFVDDDRIMIGCTRYDDYPIRFWERDDYFAVQEGMIYNLPERRVASFIDDLVSQNRKSSVSSAEVKEFLFDSDGEFVIAVYDKLSEDLIILNDALGRLPLYCYKDNQRFILSREVKFVTAFMARADFDRLAVAEFLLLRYPLGKRTLIQNVNRLDPAVLLEFDVNSGRLNIEKVHVWNFEKKLSEAESNREYADNLVKLFRDAVKCRVESLEGFKNLVSLSGGLDSRAVAAALKEEDPKLTAVTFLDHERRRSVDADIAQKTARKLHIDWKLVLLRKRRFEDLVKLITLKDCLNSAYMGFILDFFGQVKREFGGKTVYYTGDGGDKTLHSMRALRKISSMNGLIDLIMAEGPAHARAFNMDEVMELSIVSKEQMTSEIRSVLLSYPENDLNQKYVHYVFERGFKLMFEAEDRNRFYFWSTSPFWATRFFDYASKIPDSQKAHFHLYRMFLTRLNEDCLKVPYANWPQIGILAGSLPYYIFPRIQEVLYKYSSFLPNRVRNRIQISKEEQEYNPKESISNFQEIRVPSYLGEFMSLRNTEGLLRSNPPEGKFFTLISIILYALNLKHKQIRIADPDNQVSVCGL